jgi:hypothetical protein
MKRPLLSLALGVLALAPPAVPAAPLTGTLHVRLVGALARSTASGGIIHVDLPLELACRDGQWRKDFYPFNRDFNRALHVGEITEAGVAGDTVRLRVTLEVFADASFYGEPPTRGGLAEFAIELKREGDHFDGVYSGSVTDWENPKTRARGAARPVKGKALGDLGPLWPAVVTGHVPPARGEHPRLFFRRADIPKLRERAQTPEGRPIVARLRELLPQDRGGFKWQRDGAAAWPYTEGAAATGHALQFILTGEQAAAGRAKALTRLAIRRNDGEWGGWGIALRVAQAALAYDLCHDAWDESFRRECQAYFLASATGRGHEVDRHDALMFLAAGAMGALAVLNDPAPAPLKPRPPSAAQALPPLKNVEPAEGVPVVPFASGQTPGEWLAAGGFMPKEGEDPLAPLGGPGDARPTPGAEVPPSGWNKVARQFKPFSAQGRLGLYGLAEKLSVAPNATDEEQKQLRALEQRPDECTPVLGYFYTVIENDQPRVVRAVVNAPGAFFGPPRPTFGVALWLAGQRVRDGDLLRLEEGLYPLMVEVPLNEGLVAAPKLFDYSDADYQGALADWQKETDAWQAAGQTVPRAAERLNHALEFVRRHLEISLGDHGFPPEDSNFADAMHALLPFAQACRNVLGVDLARDTGLEWVVPMQMAGGGKFWHCDWGNEFWRVLGFPAVVPEAWRPAQKFFLWRATDGPVEQQSISLPSHALFALVSLPWDAPAKPPRELNLPRFFADKARGGLLFRSGWNLENDFATVITLQTDAPRSAVTAGDFSVFGRHGRTRWTGATLPGGGFFRPACLDAVERPNVLRIEGCIPTRGARQTWLAPRPDGSGVVSCVQDYWVTGSASDPHAAPKIEDPANLGIKTLRSIAVDYSGASGAPLLLAVVDKVSGAGDRERWEQLNFTHGKGGGQGPIHVAGNRFTFVPDAKDSQPPDRRLNLAGTFVPCPGSRIEIPDGNPRAPEWLKITGADDYFFVLTIQEGAAPEVQIVGAGLDAKLTVGGQTISFDGEKIVLAK